jgi:hypothetical protein
VVTPIASSSSPLSASASERRSNTISARRWNASRCTSAHCSNAGASTSAKPSRPPSWPSSDCCRPPAARAAS